jgi:ubiquinone/menaquinone biosynthesis C-methylase UbiE
MSYDELIKKRFKLTDRQLREISYHIEHARNYKKCNRISYDIIENRKRRWWNSQWRMYTILLQEKIKGKKVMIAGCGFGDDAFLLSKMGADVYAFDISSDSLAIAADMAGRENLDIRFDEMPAENLLYPDNFFDYIIARDIFHHTDIPQAFREMSRVSKCGAIVIINEIYSHSATDGMRHSEFVENVLYPRMAHFIYKDEELYITEDERKLTEHDVKEITRHLRNIKTEYFDFLSNRLFPNSYAFLSKIDRIALIIFKPIAHLLGGRVLIKGTIIKS